MLPLEIFSEVAAFLPRRDLASLARVCPSFLPIAGLELYQTLRITISDGPTHHQVSRSKHLNDAALNLLRQNGGALSGRVERLEFVSESIYAAASPNSKPVLPLDIVVQMTNLRSLYISCSSPFCTDAYQRGFIEALNTKCPLLQNFTFAAGVPTWPEESTAIKALQTIVWRGRVSNSPYVESEVFINPRLRSLLHASGNTITTLILPTLQINSGPQRFPNFARAHSFPALRKFALGAWKELESDEAPQALISFLFRHPTIVDLTLGWQVYRGNAYTPFSLNYSNPLVGSAAFLPNLRKLAAHATQVSYLAIHAPGILNNLLELRVGTGRNDDSMQSENHLSTMMRHLHRIGPLYALKKLVYVPGYSVYRLADLFLRLMGDFATIFPELESWEGALSDNLRPHVFVDMFETNFPNIRQIRITSWSRWEKGPSEIFLKDLAVRLLRVCPLLDQLSFGSSTPSKFTEEPFYERTKSTKEVVILTRNTNGFSFITQTEEEDQDTETR